MTVNTSGGHTVYPVELPRGAHKRLTGYPLSGISDNWEPVVVILKQIGATFTSTLRARRTAVLKLRPSRLPTKSEACSFSTPSRQVHDRRPGMPETVHSSVYAKPEDAPDGSWRIGRYLLSYLARGRTISDATVAALKAYVVAGGRLIFVGGSASSTYSDRRWAGFVPFTGAHSETRTVALTAAGSHFSAALDLRRASQCQA